MEAIKVGLLASRLAMAYPGRQIDEGHIASWAEELSRFDDDVAATAVERLRENFPSPPSAADVLEELRDVQATIRPAPALPEVDGTFWSPEGVEMPDEVRERIEEMQAGWADEDKRRPEEETAEWEKKKLAAMLGPKLRSPCAGVVGELTILKDGHAYCPSCGEDLDPDCPPGRRLEVEVEA
jgi:hypothetical protein